MNRHEHILTVLAEEGGEVAKECHKALRFGLDDQLTMNPDGPRGTEGPTNREKIGQEMTDLLGIYRMAVLEGLVPDLGIIVTRPDVAEAMDRKAEKVEAFMRYARRVDALNAIPCLKTMACFSHGSEPPHPFRMLIEGPQGFSRIASGPTAQALVDGFTADARSAFPPNYTAENLPLEPTPVLLIHPDYHEDEPPIVTAFGSERDELGNVRIEWKDGTKDWSDPTDLRPVFWSSLDHPDGQAARPVLQPMPTGPTPQADAIAEKERQMGELGARLVESGRVRKPLAFIDDRTDAEKAADAGDFDLHGRRIIERRAVTVNGQPAEWRTLEDLPDLRELHCGASWVDPGDTLLARVDDMTDHLPITCLDKPWQFRTFATPTASDYEPTVEAAMASAERALQP